MKRNFLGETIMLSTSTVSRFKTMGVLASAGIAAASIILPVTSANAGTITGTLAAAPSSSAASPIDISSGASDWVYYGLSASGTVSPITPATMAGGPNSFGALTGNDLVDGYFSSSTTIQPATGLNFLSFSGGTTVSSDTSNIYAYSSFTPSSFSFTQTLLGASETMNVYLNDYNANHDISASLSSGGSYTNTDATLPQSGIAGVLTLSITGSPGDTLTFTDTGVSTGSFANIGIQGVTVTAVPEPAPLCLLAVAGSLFLITRGRVLRRGV